MIWNLALFPAVAFLAYANGANDNFKGVATLFGSGTTDYRRALRWNPRVILQIMLSWLFTLPVGALIGYFAFLGGGRF